MPIYIHKIFETLIFDCPFSSYEWPVIFMNPVFDELSFGIKFTIISIRVSTLSLLKKYFYAFCSSKKCYYLFWHTFCALNFICCSRSIYQKMQRILLFLTIYNMFKNKRSMLIKTQNSENWKKFSKSRKCLEKRGSRVEVSSNKSVKIWPFCKKPYIFWKRRLRRIFLW